MIRALCVVIYKLVSPYIVIVCVCFDSTKAVFREGGHWWILNSIYSFGGRKILDSTGDILCFNQMNFSIVSVGTVGHWAICGTFCPICPTVSALPDCILWRGKHCSVYCVSTHQGFPRRLIHLSWDLRASAENVDNRLNYINGLILSHVYKDIVDVLVSYLI